MAASTYRAFEVLVQDATQQWTLIGLLRYH
jgi:hypothetical protein